MLSAADDFLDTVVAAIEDMVDPHNERSLSQFFDKMDRDNVIKNKLPKYAADTRFAKTLKALATLSIAATKACTTEMATAAHRAKTG